MSILPNPEIRTEFSIHPKTRMGQVALTVASLENQLVFYQQALGFKLHWREGYKAGLGAGNEDLLVLTEEADLKRYGGVTGLYHAAYVFPNRRELAIVMARLFALKYPNSPTDHILTKTTYLADLEGNGIELYCESPEDGTWIIQDDNFDACRSDGSVSNGREPLDVEALFMYLRQDDRLDAPVPPETHIGHVHLHVRDIDEAVDFYHGLLGFDLMGVSRGVQMAFVSAGGYHHHLGLNTWQGRNAPPPPLDAVGLRHFTIDLPSQQAFDEVVARIDWAGLPSNLIDEGLLLQDPSQNGILLSVRPD
jgi:catechol 2,3-dioxygenase